MTGRRDPVGNRAKRASARARTVGFGPHEVRGEILHVGKLPSHLGGHLSRVASPPIVSAAVRVGAVRNTAVCAKLAHLDMSPNRLTRVSAYGGIVWGEDKTRFFPDCSPVRFEQKGVVAQMVERPLCMRKVGGSMPSYSNSYFAFFLQTGSRSKPESHYFPKRATTPVCDPCREKSHVSRFFCFLSGRLFPRFGQSGTVVAQSEPSFPSFGRESLGALRVTCE